MKTSWNNHKEKPQYKIISTSTLTFGISQTMSKV